MNSRVDLRRHLLSAAVVLVALLVLAGFAGIYIYLGLYNVGADAPHSGLVYGTLDELRERSIASRARGLTPPANLDDPKRIAAGSGLYDEMCTSCHLGPGIKRTELAQGLYPAAPELARATDLSAAEQFWIIKHGVKFSAMPAWGKTHDDELIWDMVAFVRQLPKLSPERYQAIVAGAPGTHREMMEGTVERDTPSEPHKHRDGHKHNH